MDVCDLTKDGSDSEAERGGRDISARKQAVSRNVAPPPASPAPACAPAGAIHTAGAMHTPAGGSHSKPKRACETAGDRSELSSFDELEESDLEEMPGQAVRGCAGAADARGSGDGVHAQKKPCWAGNSMGRGRCSSQVAGPEAVGASAQQGGQVPPPRQLPAPASTTPFRPSLMPQGSPPDHSSGRSRASWLQQQQQQQRQQQQQSQHPQQHRQQQLQQQQNWQRQAATPVLPSQAVERGGLPQARSPSSFKYPSRSPHQGHWAPAPNTPASPFPAQGCLLAHLAVARAASPHVPSASRGRPVKVEEPLQGVRKAHRAAVLERVRQREETQRQFENQQQEETRRQDEVHGARVHARPESRLVQLLGARAPPAAQGPPAEAHASHSNSAPGSISFQSALKEPEQQQLHERNEATPVSRANAPAPPASPQLSGGLSYHALQRQQQQQQQQQQRQQVEEVEAGEPEAGVEGGEGQAAAAPIVDETQYQDAMEDVFGSQEVAAPAEAPSPALSAEGAQTDTALPAVPAAAAAAAAAVAAADGPAPAVGASDELVAVAEAAAADGLEAPDAGAAAAATAPKQGSAVGQPDQQQPNGAKRGGGDEAAGGEGSRGRSFLSAIWEPVVGRLKRSSKKRMRSGSPSCSGQVHDTPAKTEGGAGQGAPGADGQVGGGMSGRGAVAGGGDVVETGSEAAPAAETGEPAAEGAEVAAAAAAAAAAAGPACPGCALTSAGVDAPTESAGAGTAPAAAAGGAEGEGAVVLGPAARAARKLCALVRTCSAQLGQAAPPTALLDAMAQCAEAVLGAGGNSREGSARARGGGGGVGSVAAMNARLESIVRSAVHTVKAQQQFQGSSPAYRVSDLAQLVDSTFLVESWMRCGLPQSRPIKDPAVAVIIAATMPELQDSCAAADAAPDMDRLGRVSSQVIQLVGLEAALQPPTHTHAGTSAQMASSTSLLQRVLVDVFTNVPPEPHGSAADLTHAIALATAKAVQSEAWQLLTTMRQFEHASAACSCGG